MASQIMQWFTPYELFVALGLGAAVIVALAAIGSRLTRSAARQAAAWRIATVSMFLLLALELTGLGQAVAQLGRQWIASRAESGEAEKLFESESSNAAALVVPPGHRREAMVGGMTDESRLKPALQAPPSIDTLGVPPSGEGDSDIGLKPELQPSPPAQSNWLAALWLVGTAATLCWIIGGQIAAGSFRRRCSLVDDCDLYERVAALRTTFSLRRPVVLLSSSRATSPVVFGGRRPALVLPANFTQDFDRRQQDAILAHELAHLATRDAGWQAASRILCALLWWHPLVWWSRRQLRAAHEALADEGSLIVPDGPRVLAEALVALGRRLVKPPPRFGLSLGGGQFRSGLGRRVERLLNLPPRPWRAPRRKRMAFVHFSLPALVALAAILIGAAWAPSQVPIPQGDTTMSVFTTSWRGSLLATALCATLGNSPSPAAADDDPTTPPAVSDRDRTVQEKFRAIREMAAKLDEQGKHDEADRLRREAKEMTSKAGTSSADPRALHTTPPNAENEKLRAAVNDLMAMADKLERTGRPAEAESVRRKAEEIMVKLHEGPGNTRVLFVTPGNPEQEKIMARLKEMGQKIVQLESEGKHDEAEQLKREAKELYGKLHAAGPHILNITGPSPERQKLYDYYKALQGEVVEAKKSGNEEQVHRLMQEMEGLRAKLRASEERSPNQFTFVDSDREARLKHLRAAAENLKAAGCDPEAKHIMDLIGHMEAEVRTAEVFPYPMTNVRSVDLKATHDGESLAAVKELRAQIEQMRMEMREMREELKREKDSRNANPGYVPVPPPQAR